VVKMCYCCENPQKPLPQSHRDSEAAQRRKMENEKWKMTYGK